MHLFQTGARLKNGFVRALRPGVTNDRTTLFNAQFNKNASTDGAYVVLFGKARALSVDYHTVCLKHLFGF